MSFLTKREREILKGQHRSERDRRICDRIKAVLLRDEGWSYKEIAHALLLSEDAIRNHISEFERYHNLQPKGSGSCEKLSPEQSEILERHLLDHTYLYVKNIVNYVELT